VKARKLLGIAASGSGRIQTRRTRAVSAGAGRERSRLLPLFPAEGVEIASAYAVTYVCLTRELCVPGGFAGRSGDADVFFWLGASSDMAALRLSKRRCLAYLARCGLSRRFAEEI
jgi:hypothetical protein